MKKVDLIIYNISELVTVAGDNKRPRRGVVAMNNLGIITDGALAVKDGKIIAVGTTNKIKKQYRSSKTINAQDRTVTPGLVDPHTHPIFMGDRADEFELKLKGATYQEIAAKGGGIKSTVRQVRAASKQELKTNARQYLQRFINHGTTTIEAKSGYGLTLKDEIKLLEVIKELNSEFHNPHSAIALPDMVPTLLGAHEIPDKFKDNKQDYINLIKTKMIPEVSRRKLARFCDVFCEKGVFEIDDSREILESARKYGLGLKLHADEFAPLGGAELAAQLGAISADHLMSISDNGIKQMAQKGVVGVLLPGTTFALGLKNYAPARKMIDAGLPVALATDFNPGTSMTESLPMIMGIACVMMRMTPAEALVGATINAVWAIDQANNIGSLETGKDADIVLWSAPSYKHISYHFGVNLVETVIKKGRTATTDTHR